MEYSQTESGLFVPAGYKRYPTCFDFFAGCGGFSLGMIQGGFEVVGAMEIDPTTAHTYMTNLGSYPITIHYTSEQHQQQLTDYFERYMQQQRRQETQGMLHGREWVESDTLDLIGVSGSGWIQSQRQQEKTVPPVRNFWFGDIRETTGGGILEVLGMEPGELDCVVGGPPCQGFSRANRNRTAKDPRNNLVFEFARLIVEMQPKTFIFENVPAIREIVTADGVPVVDQFCRIIADGDYMSYEAAAKAMQTFAEEEQQVTRVMRPTATYAEQKSEDAQLELTWE